MLLFLITVLIALRAKSRLYAPAFAIVSNFIWGGFIAAKTLNDPADIIPMAFVSLLSGVFVHEWILWRKRKGYDLIPVIRKLSIAVISAIMLIAAINVGIIFLAFDKARSDVAATKDTPFNLESEHVDAKAHEDSGFTVTSADGYEYEVLCDANGYRLKSKYPVSRFVSDSGVAPPVSELESLSLEKNCEAHSKFLGTGKWCWANGGFVIDFAKARLGFPRQELACVGGGDVILGCRCI